mmetsp:Transcript_80914/g.177565  ORF Transcript_80914/g.177565 Transcript_80914/m.177565 type:complete len:327 (-) Transcript_80914:850-1830(-)
MILVKSSFASVFSASSFTSASVWWPRRSASYCCAYTSPRPTRLFWKFSVSAASSSFPWGLWDGGTMFLRTTSSKISSQTLCLMTASTANFLTWAARSAAVSSSASSPSPSPSPPNAVETASSARRAANCDMGWSRCTSRSELRGRWRADTSPFMDHVLSSICSSSNLATSSSRLLSLLSISYKLAWRTFTSPSSSSSSSSSASPSSSSSSPAFFLPLPRPASSPSSSSSSSSSPSSSPPPRCSSFNCFSSSASSSERSSAFRPSVPPPSSSSSSSSESSWGSSSSSSSASASASASSQFFSFFFFGAIFSEARGAMPALLLVLPPL